MKTPDVPDNNVGKINGKTPEEIKKGLECCFENECETCPYDNDCSPLFDSIAQDALAYIQQLETAVEFYSNKTQMLDARIAKLESDLQKEKYMHQYTIDAANVMKDEALKFEARLAQVERERDACIADMKQFQGVTCNACKHHYRPQPEVRHYECEIFGKFSNIFENEEGPLMCGKFEWRGLCPENTKEADGGVETTAPDP